MARYTQGRRVPDLSLGRSPRRPHPAAPAPAKRPAGGPGQQGPAPARAGDPRAGGLGPSPSPGPASTTASLRGWGAAREPLAALGSGSPAPPGGERRLPGVAAAAGDRAHRPARDLPPASRPWPAPCWPGSGLRRGHRDLRDRRAARHAARPPLAGFPATAQMKEPPCPNFPRPDAAAGLGGGGRPEPAPLPSRLHRRAPDPRASWGSCSGRPTASPQPRRPPHRPHGREHPPPRGVRGHPGRGLPLRRGRPPARGDRPRGPPGPAQRGHPQRRAPPQGGGWWSCWRRWSPAPPPATRSGRSATWPWAWGTPPRTSLLQAEALGLAAYPVGAHDLEGVARLLRLPEGCLPLYMVPVGRPAGRLSPQPRQEAESHPAGAVVPVGVNHDDRLPGAQRQLPAHHGDGQRRGNERRDRRGRPRAHGPRAGGASARREGTAPPGGRAGPRRCPSPSP